MPFTDTWNSTFEALPGDTDAISEGAERIRDTKVATRERLNVDHYFDPAGTDADHGLHRRVLFREQIADPTVAANRGAIYIKDAASVAEVHYKDEGGNVVQLTSGGQLMCPWVLAEEKNVVAAASAVFSSLVAGKQYRLHFAVTLSAAGYILLRFNADTGATAYRYAHNSIGQDGTKADPAADVRQYQYLTSGIALTDISGLIYLTGDAYIAPRYSDTFSIGVTGKSFGCTNTLHYDTTVGGNYGGSAGMTSLTIQCSGALTMSGKITLEKYKQ